MPTETWSGGETEGAEQTGAAEAAVPARSLGRFRALQKVGAGGFGTVYKAFDSQLQRTVALKVPHTARLEKDTGRERFVREARHLARLRHPGIVPIHDVDVQRDQVILITEYLTGETLARKLRDGHLHPDEAALLCAKIAKALHHAHEHGIVHRDVKPGNVMIDDQRQPCLMDFGLAKHCRRVRSCRPFDFAYRLLRQPGCHSLGQARAAEVAMSSPAFAGYE